MGLLKSEIYIKCPVCKRIVLKLVPENDDGSGRKICRDCKRNIKKMTQELIEKRKATF